MAHVGCCCCGCGSLAWWLQRRCVVFTGDDDPTDRSRAGFWSSSKHEFLYMAGRARPIYISRHEHPPWSVLPPEHTPLEPGGVHMRRSSSKQGPSSQHQGNACECVCCLLDPYLSAKTGAQRNAENAVSPGQPFTTHTHTWAPSEHANVPRCRQHASVFSHVARSHRAGTTLSPQGMRTVVGCAHAGNRNASTSGWMSLVRCSLPPAVLPPPPLQHPADPLQNAHTCICTQP